MTESIFDPLQTYCRQIFPGKINPIIENLTALNQGWENIIYAFDFVSGSALTRQQEGLILRLYPGQNAQEKSRREFEGLRRLYQAGYPVPRVYSLERENSPFGKPCILMERIEGDILWQVLDRADSEEAAALIPLFCGLFVQLHTLDWKDFVSESDFDRYQDSYVFIDQYLDWLRATAGTFPDLDAFQPVVDWLQDRRDEVPCLRPAPVHWDFHPGNVILKPDHSAVVIDWTQFQVSDLRFDLAWTLLLAGAYTGNPVRAFILSEYQRIAGSEIEHLDYFDVAVCVKRLASVMVSFSAGADQMGMRPDAVAMMRRDFPVLQRMYDLMVARCEIHIPQVEDLLAS